MGAKKEDKEIDDIINEHATAGRTSINYTAFKSIVLGVENI
jgi:Ca2+-binding EF-hand superfamily protein